MTSVVSPTDGTVVALGDVPDPVFAGQLVGAGVAVQPAGDTESPGGTGRLVRVVSPLAGEIVKLHPHAFVVVGESGTGVLVHVGIDTVKLAGQGFELAVAEGATVARGELVVSFDPAVVEAAGYSSVIPVVVLDSPADSVDQAAVGSTVASGDPLFDLPA